jgi:predicted alpha/beta hydrolase family esterase
MAQHILFIQGAGEGAHAEDAKLVDSLRQALGSNYDVAYPEMPAESSPKFSQWKSTLEAEIAKSNEPLILVGHSAGASILMRALNEIRVERPITGIFLLAAPFWGGEGWRYEGYQELELPKAGLAELSHIIHLYHSRNDDVVPFDHLALYAKIMPHALVREFNKGGHQFGNNIAQVAADIRSL